MEVKEGGREGGRVGGRKKGRGRVVRREVGAQSNRLSAPSIPGPCSTLSVSSSPIPSSPSPLPLSFASFLHPSVHF